MSEDKHVIRERRIQANGIELHVEERGSPRDPALVLVMGLGGQLTVWPEPLLRQLTDAGLRVIRFDNRDIGLSTKIEGRVRTPLPLSYARYKAGLPVEADYSLHDMARDLHAMLDALEIEQAHLVGISMGGMISQIMSATAPERVASLTLLMTSDNSPRLPRPDLRVLWNMNGGRVRGHDLAAVQARALAFWKSVQSPAYPMPEDRLLQRIADDYHRSYRPSGILRQTRAILATGSLRPLAPRIQAPTQIIHGAADPLIRVDAAHILAERIANARLEVIPGMGHDLPEPLLERLGDLILDNVERYRPRSAMVS